MWMTEYISEIKRQFRDKYNFTPCGGTEYDPTFNNIPNDVYPMEINGETDYVEVKDGMMFCNNFKKPS